MIRLARSHVIAAALLSTAMLAAPLAIVPSFAQQPATPATPAAPAPAAPAPMPAAPAAPAAAPAPAPAPAAAAPVAPAPVKKKPVAYSPRAIEIVQVALNNKGAKLDIDGTMNAPTRAALKKYQAENKLKPTGWIDSATVKSLGIKSLTKWD